MPPTRSFCSNTVAWCPSRSSSRAATRPAAPAPNTACFQVRRRAGRPVPLVKTCCCVTGRWRKPQRSMDIWFYTAQSCRAGARTLFPCFQECRRDKLVQCVLAAIGIACVLTTLSGERSCLCAASLLTSCESASTAISPALSSSHRSANPLHCFAPLHHRCMAAVSGKSGCYSAGKRR